MFIVIFVVFAAQPLIADDREPSTLGVVIRPLFFQNAAKFLNTKPVVFPLDRPFGSFTVRGNLSFKLGEPLWDAHPSNILYLQTSIQNLLARGFLIHSSGSQYLLNVSLDSVIVRLAIDPKGISTRGPNTNLVDVFFVDGTQSPIKLSLSKEGDPTPFNEILSLAEMHSLQVLVMDELRKAIDSQFSDWIFDRLRGSVMVEALSRVMKDSPLWKEGPVFTKGGMTIEMDGPPVSERETIFASYPFLRDNVFVTNSSVEIYSRATFVQPSFVTSLLGTRATSLSVDQLVTEVADKLKDPQTWDNAPFTPPKIPPAQSELSLVVSSALVNEALNTFYKKGLLRFKTRSSLVDSPQGLLASGAPPIYSIVGISPLSAPEISFEPDRAHLRIKDYSLDLSTEIEDRLIPSSRVVTNADVFADLVVDPSTQTVNLQLEPGTFQMTLEDLSHQLNADQMDVFEAVADRLWKEFLNTYSSLVLFAAPLETQKAGIKMVGIDVSRSTILLHVNLDWESLNP